MFRGLFKFILPFASSANLLAIVAWPRRPKSFCGTRAANEGLEIKMFSMNAFRTYPEVVYYGVLTVYFCNMISEYR